MHAAGEHVLATRSFVGRARARARVCVYVRMYVVPMYACKPSHICINKDIQGDS
jgi:hypothetical protein